MRPVCTSPQTSLFLCCLWSSVSLQDLLCCSCVVAVEPQTSIMFFLGTDGNTKDDSAPAPALPRPKVPTAAPAVVVRTPIVIPSDEEPCPVYVATAPASANAPFILRERLGGGTFDSYGTGPDGSVRHLVAAVMPYRRRRVTATATTDSVLLVPGAVAGTTVLVMRDVAAAAELRDVATDVVVVHGDDTHRARKWDDDSVASDSADDADDVQARARRQRREEREAKRHVREEQGIYDDEPARRPDEAAPAETRDTNPSPPPPVKKARAEVTIAVDPRDIASVVAIAKQRHSFREVSAKTVFSEVIQGLSAYAAVKASSDQQRKMEWFKQTKAEATRQLTELGCIFGADTVTFP